MLTSKLTKTLAMATVLGIGLTQGSALLAATASATASATITSAPITITNTTPLSFGDIATGDQASVVDIAVDGTRTLDSGNAILDATATGSAAAFSITGEASKAYTVTLPTTAVNLDDGSGNTMTIDNFVSNASGTIAADGTDSFNVGAKLNIAANQPAGSYSGSFNVDVVY